MAEPLALIFNLSIDTGCFPECFKHSTITPIFKAGDRTDVTNYRPISILNSFSKVFEKLVHPILYTHVEPLINANQHGFVKRKSTISNLMSFVDYVAESLDDNIQVDAIYTDFAKAFDKLNIRILLSKLKSFGVTGMVLKWFESYLIDRVQCVKFGGCTSRAIKPCSGIPQGSLLGPLLFVIFINDLPDCLRCRNLGFADDFKIFKRIMLRTDCETLQSDLEKLSSWCNTNDMELNISKCSVITFTRKKNVIDFDYSVGGVTLKRVDEIKDLGIILDTKLCFDRHINHIFRRCNKLLGFIYRACSRFRSKESLMFLYNSFVRSLCEYGAVIWNPFYKIYVDKIERIQRKFTRRLYYAHKIRKADYEVRLSTLKMQKLSVRRIGIDELYLFKIINGHVTSDLLDKFEFATNPFNLRTIPTFRLPAHSTNIRFKCPSFRLQHSHNQSFSQVNIVSHSSVVAFKSIIRAVLY